ncbi:hypothetical protein Mal64_15470 [Pseudobythopirellula maris]|uniref:Xylose isomerase-like TIM barrel n=1 Tax=Pseudobythopirellula maris TaxID=2527991 RepID=A0A5C5ZVS0_9BACT|nr:hypothetical protein [Pseudobythopirellula maris]TWT91148.1 hypothetical protein Mal64_15470 [Pseudobythopirellula maris]
MKRRIGFSTGALAYGDFKRGVELQDREGVSAIELSALRANELDGAIESLPLLNNPRFKYRSFHAPSAFEGMSDFDVAEKLKPVAELGIPIVVHPDTIIDFEPWKTLGDLVLIENMDSRKSCCRTADEMLGCFDQLPHARFCFDIGHAREVDSTMGVAIELLSIFKSRLAEIHLSEVDWTCHHIPISTSAALAFQRLARRIPEDVPVIIESVIDSDSIDAELKMAERCLEPNSDLLKTTTRVAPALSRTPAQ